jgi:hypothetical protein
MRTLILPVRGHEMEPCGTRKNILPLQHEDNENDSTSISFIEIAFRAENKQK